MICPTCGRTQLTERPHLHAEELNRRRPSTHLDPDPLYTEPDPSPVRRAGCLSLCVALVVVLWRVGW